MTRNGEKTKSRGRAWRRLVVCAGVAVAVVTVGAGIAIAAHPAPSPTPAPVPPVPHAPEIRANQIPVSPAAGKGRIVLAIGGNRKWCTYPDDRLMKPEPKPGQTIDRHAVFTYGYKFSISAVRRGQADLPLMLYESPTFRTATLLPAAKLGRGKKPATGGPVITSEEEHGPHSATPIGPDTLVPRWEEINRCVTLPEEMDFDLDPGTYDVYMAFDIMGREGGWVHRSMGHITDVPVEASRNTRLDGVINMASGADRQVDIDNATLEPASPAGDGTPGS